MSSCDFIRDGKGKGDHPSPSQKNVLLNHLLHRSGSHHKSHEVLPDYKNASPLRDAAAKEVYTRSIDRKETKKRNSRSEDNLLGLAQKLNSQLPQAAQGGGQIILTQDFFTKQRTTGDHQQQQQQRARQLSKELLLSSPSTTSTEELDQIDAGGRRRFGKDSHEELSDPDYRSSDEGKSQEDEGVDVGDRGGSRGRLDFSELKKKLVIDDKMMPPLQSPNGSTMTDAQGLIMPKKLVNPCVLSTDRQNLHRELMFNNKTGRSVLNQKSELQRVLDKQKERQFAAQQQQQEKQLGRDNLSGELGRVIMQRAQRLENLQNSQPNQDEEAKRINPEYVNARAKLKATAAAGGAYDCK